ncbi:heavy-metal-associated domain-containing protein [Streptomyces radiopugnans]|nr:heavy-metal-associated domain-containing protein [Streptomyces radiopugnans]
MSLLSGLPGVSGLRLPVPPLVGLVPEGVTAGAREAVGTSRRLAGQLVGVSRRAVWSRPGRCYITVHGINTPEGERTARRVERLLERHPGVLWARVNAPSGRVVVALESPPPPERELVALVERAEGHVPCADEEHEEWCHEPHHPCEGPRTGQSVTALAADVVGLGLSTLNRVAPWTPLPPEVASLTGAVARHPRLRRLVAQGLHDPQQADSLLPVLTALTQGVATRGGGLVLDVVERMAQWREAGAYRRAWEEAEARLVGSPGDAAANPVAVERPVPPPPDAVDRYVERSMALTAAAGAAAAPFTGPRRGLAVALSGVPKAPDAGREGFATTLGRALALRGTTVMDRSVLRRLGQTDTVVLDEEALSGSHHELADLVPLEGADPQEAAERLFALFVPERVGGTHRDEDGWVLGPLEELELTGRRGARAAARLRRQGSESVLGLARGRRLMAVAGLARQKAPGADAVAAAARRAGVRVVLASARPEFGLRLRRRRRPRRGPPHRLAARAAGGRRGGAAAVGRPAGAGRLGLRNRRPPRRRSAYLGRAHPDRHRPGSGLPDRGGGRGGRPGRPGEPVPGRGRQRRRRRRRPPGARQPGDGPRRGGGDRRRYRRVLPGHLAGPAAAVPPGHPAGGDHALASDARRPRTGAAGQRRRGPEQGGGRAPGGPGHHLRAAGPPHRPA